MLWTANEQIQKWHVFQMFSFFLNEYSHNEFSIVIYTNPAMRVNFCEKLHTIVKIINVSDIILTLYLSVTHTSMDTQAWNYKKIIFTWSIHVLSFWYQDEIKPILND